MIRHEVYRDLDGREFALASLDADEQLLVKDFQRLAATKPEWHDFDNYWLKAVRNFYGAKGVSRKEYIQTPVFEIAQDLSSRIALAAGLVRNSDYRDQLEEIARERFKTRREFCEATGMSEDMASHLFAGRKHLSLETLTEVVQRLGCVLRIVPIVPNEADGTNAVVARNGTSGDSIVVGDSTVASR